MRIPRTLSNTMNAREPTGWPRGGRGSRADPRQQLDDLDDDTAPASRGILRWPERGSERAVSSHARRIIMRIIVISRSKRGTGEEPERQPGAHEDVLRNRRCRAHACRFRAMTAAIPDLALRQQPLNDYSLARSGSNSRRHAWSTLSSRPSKLYWRVAPILGCCRADVARLGGTLSSSGLICR